MEQGFAFAGQGELEATFVKEVIRGRNRHHLEDFFFLPSIHAGLHESLADAVTAILRIDREAAQFSELLRVDFQRCKPDNPPVRQDGCKAMPGEVGEFVMRAG